MGDFTSNHWQKLHVSKTDMGVCAGGCSINITFESETFRSFNSSEDDLNTKIMAKFLQEILKFSDIIS